MTRDEICRRYQVIGDVIRSPGIYEGEPVWVPHFWELSCEGLADGETTEFDYEPLRFTVFQNDRLEFPELKDFDVVQVQQDRRTKHISGRVIKLGSHGAAIQPPQTL